MGRTADMRPGAAAGARAGAVALAVGEVLAAVVPGAPSLVGSVGQEVIDRVPPAVEDAAISLFGTSDKLALVVGIIAVSLVIAAALGVAARRRFGVAVLGFVAFGMVGLAAAAGRPEGEPVPALLAAGAGVAAGLVTLRRLTPDTGAIASAGPSGGKASAGLAAPTDPPTGGRRRFLHLTAVAAGAVVAAGAAGGALARWVGRGTGPEQVRLAPAARPLAPAVPAASLEVDGLSPLFTPNRDFYRIDTALAAPRIDLETWRLRVTGMVDQPLELSFDDLSNMRQVEADITLSCVSNEVGGDLVDNARWRGVPLAELLEQAGVRPGADQVVGRSVDGWTGGFPTAAALDGRDALVALGMNGEALPVVHGFPARLVVPGLYGYVSATKWLSEIELTTLEGFDGYWVPRGWSKLAPVKTQSRIDMPAGGARLAPGRHAVAGVAWAPIRGVAKVEVSVDGGTWTEAVLSEPLGDAAWRQWRWTWDAGPGRHRLRVRATDGDGTVQTERSAPPRPDGATGYHTVEVVVTDRP